MPPAKSADSICEYEARKSNISFLNITMIALKLISGVD
jgi:hypothetical protein